MVFDGQIRLGELLSRVVQHIYAETLRAGRHVILDPIHSPKLAGQLILQHAQHVGQCSQTYFGRLGCENQEAGG